jgi:hypothetical protein
MRVPVGTKIPQQSVIRPKFSDYSGLSVDLRLANQWGLVGPKLDGIYGKVLVLPEHGMIEYWSRNGILKDRIPLPKGLFNHRCILHGEYMFGSNWGIKRGIDRHFFVFDCESIAGQAVVDRPFSYRLNYAQQAAARLRNVRFHAVPFVSASNTEEVWKHYVLRHGYEGLVWRNANDTFGESMARAKREVEVEYICMGFNQSDADKYAGRMVKSIVSGLLVDGKLTKVTDISGMTEAQRIDFFNNPNKYIGKVFTARGRGLFDSGSLRHPNYRHFRDDKEPEECTMGVIEEMLSFDLGIGF